MSADAAVGADRSIVIPPEIGAKYGLRPGDTVQIVESEGILLLVLDGPAGEINRAAREIEADLLEAGVDVDEMFASLRDERERYYREKYGPLPE